jgi:hypothetical protein
MSKAYKSSHVGTDELICAIEDHAITRRTALGVG